MRKQFVIAAAILAAGAAFASRAVSRKDSKVLLAPLRFETSTGTAHIYTVKTESGHWERILEIDGAEQSAMYLDGDLRNELVFEYHKLYGRIFDFATNARHVLVLGGGGCSYPKYLVSHYTDIVVDVVEFDDKVVDIAMRYFDLSRALDDPSTKGRLFIIENDARSYVRSAKKLYDVIVNDCFVGLSPARDLATLEAAREIKDALTPDGVYAANIMGAREGERSGFLRACISTLQRAFEHVYLFSCAPDQPHALSNNVVIATDAACNADGVKPYELLDASLVLHDEAPVAP